MGRLKDQSRYLVLADANGGGNVPRHSHHRRDHGCCTCGSICCCCCCFFLIFFFIIALLVAVFIYINPKPPSYSMDNLSVSNFEINNDFILQTHISATIRIENPNRKIGIKYEYDSNIVVAFQGTNLCTGKLPNFYQGYRNTTIMTIEMKGSNKFGSELQTALLENKKNGHIPLDVYAKIPVKLVIDDNETRSIMVNIHCEIVLDNFEPSKKLNVKSTNYHVSIDW